MKVRFLSLLVLLHVYGVLVIASLEPTGMAKPIADLRDYNGTYEGSIGTGTIGYTTLYRDNQDNGIVSGCRGEGCGRHPGVDIPVSSGTNVYNVLAGTVVKAECDETWGGLIVVKATDPWNWGSSVFLVYSHLRSLRYSNGMLVLPGDYVTTGRRIGQSGGNPNTDKCSGRSTGAHLHFQIDRDDGDSMPYFPALSQLNRSDSNFEVPARTLNPIPFLVGGYRWTFAQRHNRELWDLFNFQSFGVDDNALWTDSGFDPYIRRGGLTNCGRSKPCSSSVAAEASEYSQVYLDLANQCLSGSSKIYFTTSLSPGWSESKTVFYYPSAGSWRGHVYMASNSNWRGVITGLRVDPSEQCNPYAWDPTYYGEITIER
jgi:hypothetical protein